MYKFKKTLGVVLFISAFLISFGQSSNPKKVLFVGNSYTYFWNLPQSVMTFAKGQGINIEARQSTSGGTNLGQHWRGEKKLKTVDKIKEGNFDMIILQDHSKRAIDHPDSLLHYGKLLGKLIKKSGAKPYVYMTWGREWDSTMQAPITKEYVKLAKKINATIVPVGPTWQRARELRPELVLYDEDGSHPSALGTYLTACVFYGVLTQTSPVGLPKRIISKDGDGEKLYLNIQSAETALFCQKVAEEIINKWKNN